VKGIILAGGLGTRLNPLTAITNKHLLPVYDKPMIYYPIETLVDAGIDDIMVVTGGQHAGEFLRLLGNGKAFGLDELRYAYQAGEGGIAEALGLTEHFADQDRVVVMLGDNIVEKSIRPYVEAFESQRRGAKILLKEVPNPREFGVAEVDGDPGQRSGRVVRIVEKPTSPKTNYAVVGIYMYDARVFDIIKTLKPSARGELEITDVNNAYIEAGEMTFAFLDGWWADAGESCDALLRTSQMVAERAGRGASS
jgi:glucose-1-phosphate thymidylyltransferase